MKTTVWTIWLMLLLPLAGCGGGKKSGEEPPSAEAGHEEQHAGEEHAAEEGTLAVDAEVLRDLKLTTFPAELRPGGEGVTALGEVRVNEQAYAEVGTPIPARIIRLVASPGQAVRRGQPLAELQSVELGQARARRTAALARTELARQTVERKRGLAAERIVSRGELQRAEAEAAEAEADLRAAEAALDALGIGRGDAGGLSAFTLLAPLTGTVLERTAVQGQTAAPDRSLFRIADLASLWLVAQAAERDAVRLRTGAAAEVVLAALPGRKLPGTVEWIGGEVDPHSRTIPIRIVLANPDGRLRPGMFATAWIATGEAGAQVVAVPATALQRMGDRWVVFLDRGRDRGAGRFEVRPVERGRDLGNEVAILSGLKPGEPVVVEGAFVLRAEAEKQEGGAEPHHH